MSSHLKNGSQKSQPKDSQKLGPRKSNLERYDQDGRTANRVFKKKNRKLKTIGKVEVSISNSTYKEYNSFLKNKER